MRGSVRKRERFRTEPACIATMMDIVEATSVDRRGHWEPPTAGVSRPEIGPMRHVHELAMGQSRGYGRIGA